MIKRYLKIIFILTLFHACAQEKKATSTMNEITEDNFREKLIEEVKHYDIEPFYKIHSKGINCDYEILVNDLDVYKSYDGYSDFTGTQINYGILKSGEQRVTIKVFPLKVGEMLTKETNAYFKVVEVDNTTNHLDEKTITSLVLPSDADGNFAGAGLPYFEKTITFNATVPYELVGWSESKDLSKLDEKKLQKMVTSFYIKHGELDVAKKINKILNLSFSREREIAITMYTDKKTLENDILKVYQKTAEYAIRFEFTTPYKMNLYGNNRLVRLDVISGERKGKGAYSLFSRAGTNEGYSYAGFYLHIPKGKTELEIIR